MAVANTMNRGQQKNPLTITYKAGDADVTLSPSMVKNYLVSGDASQLTNQEIVMFMNLCKYQGLNPFIRDAYLVKYGSQAATIVTGKVALEKRAARCDRYRGFEAGIIVKKQDSTLEHRTGTFCLPEEELVGGWAKVYVDGYVRPIEAAVSIQEYIGRKKNGEINGQWASKPATMIRKVAKVQALREAFPEDMQGMYTVEESGDIDDLPVQPVDVQAAPVQQEAVEVQEVIEAQIVEPAQDATDDFADIMGA
ncbi:MAG: phage recombination protein Bet [Oscillospiraceae bacterium]|nr:phage recombination protein Bet [Oscillospiraceae bacterium]